MRRILTTSVALASTGVLAVAAIGTFARADGGDGELGWLKETTDRGCYRLFPRVINARTLQGQGFVWTGPCTPGQPISGEGTFYRQYPNGFVMAYTGRITNGFQDGPTRVATYQVTGGAFPPSGSPRSDGQVNYRMGCEDLLGDDCRPGSPMNIVNVPQVSPAHFPLPGGPSSFAGSTSSNASESPTSARSNYGDCQPRLEPGEAGGFWRVVNTCSYPIIGKWCYKNDGSFSCDKHMSGGFGPIKPGRQEAISSPGQAQVEYLVTWCDYDDWNAGDCRTRPPWEVEQ